MKEFSSFINGLKSNFKRLANGSKAIPSILAAGRDNKGYAKLYCKHSLRCEFASFPVYSHPPSTSPTTTAIIIVIIFAVIIGDAVYRYRHAASIVVHPLSHPQSLDVVIVAS